MRQTLLAAAVAVCFSLPSVAADRVCVLSTKNEFIEFVSGPKRKAVLFWAKPYVLDRVLVKINERRKVLKLWPLEATSMLVGYMPNRTIGVVLFDKNDCVVPGGEQVDTQEEWVNRMSTYGFAPQDFVPLIKGNSL